MCCNVSRSKVYIVLLSYIHEQVQNDHLYIRYIPVTSIGESPRNQSRGVYIKSVQATALCDSIAESTLQILLTFFKVKEAKHENFYFARVLSFCILLLCHHTSLKNYVVYANIIPTKRLLHGMLMPSITKVTLSSLLS